MSIPQVGYSHKISDPAFEKYRKDSKRWSYLFSVILFLAAAIGFPIYGNMSGELDMPYSLYYGLGIGGMFLAIAFFQSLSRDRDTTWDGTVVDKRTFKRQQNDKNSDTFTTVTVYEYKVKRESGKVYTHRTTNNDIVYNYFNVGDRVRHHKGFGGYEKYDKSRDTILFCTACATINESANDVCFRCKCPLLK